MSNPQQAIMTLRKFRMTVVRYSLLLTGVSAIVAYRFDPVVTQGLLLGGLGGVLGFWLMARNLEKLATVPAEKVKFAVLAWSFYRFAIYGAVLIKAFTLDRDTMHGLMAAVAGILFVRLVLMFLGFTGIDLGPAGPTDQEDR